MNDPRLRIASVSFCIVAALLVLFGVSAVNDGRPNGYLQIAMAVLMGGAGLFLLTGRAEARTVGLVAAGITVAAGIYSAVVDGIYIAGTFFALFGIYQLRRAGNAVDQPGRTDDRA
jgi:hypothetical protein